MDIVCSDYFGFGIDWIDNDQIVVIGKDCLI